MKWTAAMPTSAGWYFWRPDENTHKVFRRRLPEGVYRLEMAGFEGHERLHLALPKDKNRYPADWMAGSWAGPIPEPEDAAEVSTGVPTFTDVLNNLDRLAERDQPIACQRTRDLLAEAARLLRAAINESEVPKPAEQD